MKTLFKYYSDEGPERCGFITEAGVVVEVDNCSSEPERGFEIDPKVVLDYLGKVRGVWHTHPNADSVFSGEDKRYMLIWPDLEHWVVGKDGARKYIIKSGAVIDEDFSAR